MRIRILSSLLSLTFALSFISLPGCSSSSSQTESATSDSVGPPYSKSYAEDLFTAIDSLYDTAALSLTNEGDIYSYLTSENIYLFMKRISGATDTSLTATINAQTITGSADADLVQGLTGPFLFRFSVSPTFYLEYASGNSSKVLTPISKLSLTTTAAADVTTLDTSGDGFSVQMTCDRSSCAQTCSCECKRYTFASDQWTADDITTDYTEGDPTMTCTFYDPDFFVAGFANYACEAGKHSTTTTGRAPCVKCAIGSYADTEGSTTCLPCSPGTYAGSEGSATCTNCAAGTYNNAMGQSTCISCTPGSYQSTPGQTTCLQCPVGTFSSGAGSAACTPCSAGTFNSNMGANACVPCTPGSHQPAQGEDECITCPADTYQPSFGQAVCLPCPGAAAGSVTCD